jgi:hypothetical protein
MVDGLARVFLVGVFPVALALAGCDVDGVLPQALDGGVGGTTSSGTGGSSGESGGSDALLDAGRGGSGNPADASTPVVNLWEDASFEAGMDGWTPVGNARLSRSTEASRTGAASLLVASRVMDWEGPGRSLMNIVPAGGSYDVAAWVRLANAPESPVETRLTLKRRCDTDPELGSFVALATTTAEDEWTPLLGSFEIPACALTELLVFIEVGSIMSETPLPDYYVDDVSLTATP